MCSHRESNVDRQDPLVLIRSHSQNAAFTLRRWRPTCLTQGSVEVLRLLGYTRHDDPGRSFEAGGAPASGNLILLGRAHNSRSADVLTYVDTTTTHNDPTEAFSGRLGDFGVGRWDFDVPPFTSVDCHLTRVDADRIHDQMCNEPENAP